MDASGAANAPRPVDIHEYIIVHREPLSLSWKRRTVKSMQDPELPFCVFVRSANEGVPACVLLSVRYKLIERSRSIKAGEAIDT